MVARIVSRGKGTPAIAGRVRAAVMDGMALGLPDGSFDAAISVFGVILFPRADLGMHELARVLKPGGRAAIVTWTETERYELAARLLGAIAAVREPQPPPASLPAQLRYRDNPTFHRLLSDAGLVVNAIVRVEERWRIPSARWIADRITFAPGMAAMVDALGSDRAHVLDTFVAALERDQGEGEVTLSAIAHIGMVQKPRSAAPGAGTISSHPSRAQRPSQSHAISMVRWLRLGSRASALEPPHVAGDIPCRIHSPISGIL
jgi:SAM-dependent methyltransferase